MKAFFTVAALWLFQLPVYAGALPDISVSEVTTGDGGIYTVTINQPPSPPGPIWSMTAWGIGNNPALFAETLLTGWTAGVFDQTSWDSGLVFETGTPGKPIFLFSAGAPNESEFSDLFGLGANQGVVFWNESYLGNPLVATSSNFNWFTIGRSVVERHGAFNAFVVISAPGQTSQICTIGIGQSQPLDCVAVSNPNGDSDGDFVPDAFDNCTLIENPNQDDADEDGYGNACDPDLNNDGIVNFLDLSLFSQVFLTDDANADFNVDGIVNFVDLLVLSEFFFLPPGPGLGI